MSSKRQVLHVFVSDSQVPCHWDKRYLTLHWLTKQNTVNTLSTTKTEIFFLGQKSIEKEMQDVNQMLGQKLVQNVSSF